MLGFILEVTVKPSKPLLKFKALSLSCLQLQAMLSSHMLLCTLL